MENERISAHELFDRGSTAKVPSERSFGVVFTIVLALIGLWPLIRLDHPRYWFLFAAAGLLGVTYWAPWILRRPNQLWYRVGMLLHKFVSPWSWDSFFL